MKSRHLAMLALALLPACASNDSGGLRLDIPSNTDPSASRVVVIYERGPNGWKASGETPLPFSTPAQMVLPSPPIPGPPPGPPPKKNGCPIYSMPSLQPMPELPTLGPRGVSEEKDQEITNLLMKHIGEIRQYTISIRRQMRQSYDDYIKTCNADKDK